MKTEGVMGCILLVASGCIYAFERFLSLFEWVTRVGTGSWPSNPKMPGIFDNIFVPTLFIIGLLLIIISFISMRKEKIFK